MLRLGAEWDVRSGDVRVVRELLVEQWRPGSAAEGPQLEVDIGSLCVNSVYNLRTSPQFRRIEGGRMDYSPFSRRRSERRSKSRERWVVR